MRTAPGSASKDPTKVPFLWHQSKEFQPGFIMGFFLFLFNKMKAKQNLYSKKSSAGSKNVSEFNNLVKKLPLISVLHLQKRN